MSLSLSEKKIKLEVLDGKVFDLEYLVKDVNSVTKAIKYSDAHMDIIMKIEDMAEFHGIDIEDQVDDVRKAFNNLESTVYELVSPFEDKLREAENDRDDLDSEIAEDEYEL